MLRRGLPATFSKAASTIYSSEHEDGESSGGSTEASSAGKRGVSAGKKGGVTNGVSDEGFGTYTGLSRMRALLQSGSAAGGSSSSSGGSSPMASCGSAVDLLALQQQGAAAGGSAPRILLNNKVLGGYVWELSLVAVPYLEPSKPAGNSSSSSSSSLVAAAAAAIETPGSGAICAEAAVQKKQLCLSVVCRPAWANALDKSNPEYDATAVSHDSAAAAAAVTQLNGKCTGLLCGAGAAATGQQSVQKCVTCDALWTVAGAKTAEAVARHMPLAQHLLPAAAAQVGSFCCSCSSNSSSVPAAAAAGLTDQMQVCEMPQEGEAAAAAAAAAAVAKEGVSNSSWACGVTTLDDCCSAVKVPGFCCSTQGCSGGGSSSSRVVYLDVVVGIQLVAAASQLQLQQQVGPGGNSSMQSPAVSHVPCLLLWDAVAGAARGLVPIDVVAIGSGGNVLDWYRQSTAAAAVAAAGNGANAGGDNAEGVAAAAGRGASSSSSSEVGVLKGWQPELWSALAPSGALYWHASLRPLMD
jgi:hypothetical protein